MKGNNNMNNAGRPIMHVGKLNNTNRNCVLVFPQNPHNKEMALVVDVDSLPKRYQDDIHDHFMRLVENEGQSVSVLADILGRKFVPDTNTDWMNYLARGNGVQSFLQPQPINNITLYPFPNNPIPLESVVKINNPTMQDSPSVQPQPNNEKFNQHIANQSADKFEDKVNIAKNILYEAELLEADARKKRERAYEMAPSLRPTVKDIEKKTKKTIVEKVND